jgi:hypothetical protein
MLLHRQLVDLKGQAAPVKARRLSDDRATRSLVICACERLCAHDSTSRGSTPYLRGFWGMSEVAHACACVRPHTEAISTR